MFRMFIILIFSNRIIDVLAGEHLTCHDCSGTDNCEALLATGRTGRCSVPSPGKCFIRTDPNGILYRGCADRNSWPELNLGYTGCRYQSYGWWSDKPVLWCFCNSDLCNVDVDSVQDGDDSVGAIKSDRYLKSSNMGSIASREKGQSSVSRPSRALVSAGQYDSGFDFGGSVGKEASDDWYSTGGSGRFATWDEYQSYYLKPKVDGKEYYPISEEKSNKRSKGKNGQSYFPVNPQPVYPPIFIFPPVKKSTYLPPLSVPDIPDFTTPPNLGQTTTTPLVLGPNTTTVIVPTTTPTTSPVTHPGPIYNIPEDLLRFLLKNLPKNKNDVHTISHPIYILLYLLSSSGIDLSTIPGLNITGLNISTITPDIPGGNYSFGCIMAGCEQYCEYILNQPVCRCRSGFLISVNNKNCTDIDECRVNNGDCNQLCYNTVGSYFCNCQPNYQLASDQRTCQDINECSYNNGGCSDTCRNLPGSYLCSCPQGFSLGLDNRTCLSNTGQCTTEQQQSCNQRCTANGDSATCSCYQGYVLDTDGSTCTDIDECSDDTASCNQTCTNTPGSFICSCRTGYRVASNLRDCIDEDECLQNNGGCRQSCVNIPGSYYCDCEAGYAVGADGRSCEDVDECSIDNGGCTQNCTNIPGSFICSCKSDLYQLQPDKMTCIGACPDDFIKNDGLGSCYRIFTSIEMTDARPVAQAQDACKQLHPVANLVSVETIQEKNYLAQLLSKEPVMLEGWQGWWTSGSYRTGVNQFYWRTGSVIPNNGDFWGFQRPPFRDTCVWILQIPNYNYTLGNYDCFTSSGYICEITYGDLFNDP